MITLERIYLVVGAFFAAMALLSLFDRSNARRVLNFVFWGLLAASFFAGNLIGDRGNGALALGLALVGAIGLGQGRATRPPRRKNAAQAR